MLRGQPISTPRAIESMAPACFSAARYSTRRTRLPARPGTASASAVSHAQSSAVSALIALSIDIADVTAAARPAVDGWKKRTMQAIEHVREPAPATEAGNARARIDHRMHHAFDFRCECLAEQPTVR